MFSKLRVTLPDFCSCYRSNFTLFRQLFFADIRDGQLKAILGLFFSLSRYKQQQKSLAAVAANVKQQQQQFVASGIPLPSHAHSVAISCDKMSK